MKKNGEQKREHAIQNPAVMAMLKNFDLEHVHFTITCKVIYIIIN